MVEECKYCSDVIKSILTKKLMTKKVVVALRIPLNVWFVIMIVLMVMLK